MNRGQPCHQLSLVFNQLQLDLTAAQEALRKARENPKKFKKSPSQQLEHRLARCIESIEKVFYKVFEQIDEIFVNTSDEEFIDDSSPVSDDSSDSEPEYITSSDELSENEEFVSSEEDSDNDIEILPD